MLLPFLGPGLGVWACQSTALISTSRGTSCKRLPPRHIYQYERSVGGRLTTRMVLQPQTHYISHFYILFCHTRRKIQKFLPRLLPIFRGHCTPAPQFFIFWARGLSVRACQSTAFTTYVVEATIDSNAVCYVTLYWQVFSCVKDNAIKSPHNNSSMLLDRLLISVILPLAIISLLPIPITLP